MKSFGLTSDTRLQYYFSLTSARTGRLSCCRPNLQSLPNRQIISYQMADSSLDTEQKEAVVNIRSAFQAPEG
jgi:DNA polymerase I-like protein with 3'-5' exonuclease and polymerase domains